MPALVSIIIPTHNRQVMLKEAVASVRGQSFKDWELFIIDDGSTDGTKKELQDINGDGALTYVYQKHQGVSAARNNGIKRARGQYICFLDSDDLWHKSKLEKQLTILESQKQVAAVYTGEAWYRNGQWLNQLKKHRKYSGRIFAKALPLCIISPSSIMLRRAVITELGGFDERLPVCEDYDYWLRLTARYPVYYLPDRLITKRGGHLDQLSQSAPALDRFRLYALEKAIRDPALRPQDRAQALAMYRYKSAVLRAGARKRGRWLYWLYMTARGIVIRNKGKSFLDCY